MIEIKNIREIRTKLPTHITLVSVSKYHSTETIMEAYNEGIRIFGENRPQELKEKQGVLPKNIQWHMIGNLQKNKVKYIAPFVHLIESVDSLDLLKVIEKEGKKNERILSCLLQIKIATEESKSGMSKEELIRLLTDEAYLNMQHIRICGLMGMATHTSDTAQIHSEFRTLKNLYTEIKQSFFKEDSHFKHLSMGMSNDYSIAIEEGSTMIRLGTAVFGPRI